MQSNAMTNYAMIALHHKKAAAVSAKTCELQLKFHDSFQKCVAVNFLRKNYAAFASVAIVCFFRSLWKQKTIMIVFEEVFNYMKDLFLTTDFPFS